MKVIEYGSGWKVIADDGATIGRVISYKFDQEIDHVQYYSARVEIHAELPKRECPTCGYETNDPNFDFTHMEGK